MVFVASQWTSLYREDTYPDREEGAGDVRRILRARFNVILVKQHSLLFVKPHFV